jgi:hypothetical protein
MAAIFSSGRFAPNSGVPFRSENLALQVRQRSIRRCLFGP